MPADAEAPLSTVAPSAIDVVDANGLVAHNTEQSAASPADEDSTVSAAVGDTAAAFTTPAAPTSSAATPDGNSNSAGPVSAESATTSPSTSAAPANPTASPDGFPTSTATATPTPTPAPAPAPAPFPSDAALLSHLHAYLSSADLTVVTNKIILQHLDSHFQHDLGSKKAFIKAAVNRFMEADPKPASSDDNGTASTEQPGAQTDTTAHADEAEAAEEEEEERSEETQEEKDHRLAMEMAAEDGRPRRSAAAQSNKRAEKRRLKETSASTNPPAKKAKKSAKPATLYSLSPALSAFLPGQPSEMSWGDVVKALWAYFREHKLQDERNKKRILLDEPLQSVFGKDRKTVDAFKMNTLLTRHLKKKEELA